MIIKNQKTLRIPWSIFKIQTYIQTNSQIKTFMYIFQATIYIMSIEKCIDLTIFSMTWMIRKFMVIMDSLRTLALETVIETMSFYISVFIYHIILLLLIILWKHIRKSIYWPIYWFGYLKSSTSGQKTEAPPGSLWNKNIRLLGSFRTSEEPHEPQEPLFL